MWCPAKIQEPICDGGRAGLPPGTIASLAAIPVHYVLRLLPPVPHVLIIVALLIVGCVTSQRAAEAAGRDDPGSVVMDEVVGMLVACWFVRKRKVPFVALAFVLFQFLDRTKPAPIGWAEHWGPPGVSIMLDDLLCGLPAGVLSEIAARLFPMESPPTAPDDAPDTGKGDPPS